MSGSWRAPPPALPAATLAANLAAAQAALQALLTGAQIAEASYAEGSGSRTVRYTQASRGALQAYIEQLQTAQGYRARSAIGMRF